MKTALLLSVLFAAMAVTASLICGSETCANDEFCNSASNTCQCNSTLYTYTGANPSPNVTCGGGNFTILLSKCWLERNGFNSSNITLQSASCLAQREVVNGTAQMGIHQPLVNNECGTTSTVNDTHVVYQNKLYIYAKTIPIQPRQHVVMNISCTYPLIISNISLNFPLNATKGTTVISVPGSSAAYTVNMVAYKNDQYNIPLTTEDTLYVEQPIYISVDIPGLDATAFSVQVLRIYATGDAEGATPFDLLVNGCPSSDPATAGILSVDKNGDGTEARFPMKVFQITGFAKIRLSADIRVCEKTCVPDCKTKASRADSSTATVSIIYEPTERIDDSSLTSSAIGFSMPQILPALLSSWILVKLM